MSLRLVLASGSPRRRRLLAEAGYHFAVEAPEVDETQLVDEAASDMVLRLALAKADAVLARRSGPTVVLACDTAVALGSGEVLGKPEDRDDAVATLLRIGGRSHEVVTGFAVVGGEYRITGIERSDVVMTPIDRADAIEYVATGEPLDKAGAYAIQGIGRRFVDRYDGSFANIIGLPMEAIRPVLASVGIVPGRCEPGPASV